jgi:iron complex outermembrane receptor protein
MNVFVEIRTKHLSPPRSYVLCRLAAWTQICAKGILPAVLAALASFSTPIAVSAQQQNKDLTSASLEDLMNMQVTSVSRTSQKVSNVAAAIFVITQEDIHRSGATNIPDLLRIVPGVQVAQVNANKWAISARGLNDLYSNELLVLVDGRTVYTPSFGGVFWDVLDVPLDDIEQIEVIRGPGSSVWGSNAVNGVINIITKKAKDTRGGLLVARGGNANGQSTTIQYGGALRQATDLRVYAKYSNQEELETSTGTNAADGWHVLRGGFRADSALSSKDILTIEGDIYSGRESNISPFFPTITSSRQTVDNFANLSGGFIQTTWNHKYSAHSDSILEFSYDQYGRTDILDEQRHTFDVNFQHHFVAGRRNDFVWGGGYHVSKSQSTGSVLVSLVPNRQTFQRFNGFIQDDIAMVPELLHITIGTKLEHSQYTGFAFMPSVRVAVTPSASHTVWASISRAIRTPSVVDAASRINLGPIGTAEGLPIVLSVFGNPNVKNENSLSYEAGYRASLTKKLTVDVATYYNAYTDQETSEPEAIVFESTPAPAHLLLPTMFANLSYGESHGLEAYATWKPFDRWTISPGYSFERIHVHAEPSSLDTTSAGAAEGSTPVNSGQLRSHLVVSRDLGWDTSAYFVGRLIDPAISSYVRLDSGLTWQVKERFSISVLGQNLLQPKHAEFTDTNDTVGSALMKRGGYVKLRWTF